MELILSNINNYTISNITNTSYWFSNITPGDPYRVVADVFDQLDFQHILTNIVLSNGYIWPVDDISGLDFGIELKDDIAYEIKKAYIRPDEIPVFIHCNITDVNVSNYSIQFDLYAEPLTPYTYKPHTKKKYVSNEIVNLADNTIKYYLSDLDMLITYNIFASLKIKPPGTDEWKYVTSHVPIASNITTIDPGVYINLIPLLQEQIEKMCFIRKGSGYVLDRSLTYHVREYKLEDLYDNMRSSPIIQNVNIIY